MLLQTNSYVVPRDKRAEHARLLRKFRQTLARLGCDHFEVYEQVGSNWSSGETTGRFVQIMRFRDRRHQQAVQAAERSDPAAQTLIQEFCELINFPYQQQQGLFAVGFYTSALPIASPRARQAGAAAPAVGAEEPSGAAEAAGPVAQEEEEELVVEAHAAETIAPDTTEVSAVPVEASDDDAALASLSAGAEPPDERVEAPAEDEPAESSDEADGFMSEELAMEESPEQRDDLPDALDLDDLAELQRDEQGNDKSHSA